jgi:hypothetical protein
LVAQGQIKGDSGESQGVCARVVNGEGSGYLNGPGAPSPARSDAPSDPLALFRQNGARPERPLSLRFRTGPTRRRRRGRWLCSAKKHDAGARGLAERTQTHRFWQNEPKKLNDYRARVTCADAKLRLAHAILLSRCPHPIGMGHWDSWPRRSIVPNASTWNVERLAGDGSLSLVPRL